MKCLQLHKPGVLRMLEAGIPDRGPDEVLLKVSHCALCRTDAKMWKQGHRDLIVPRILGHEICGSVHDRSELFVVWPGTSCNRCGHCLEGAENLCHQMRIMGFHRDGGLAEFVSVPRSSLIRAPEDLPRHVACLAEPLACTLNALEQAEITQGKRVLIYGAGPVGLLMALAARHEGALPFVLEKNASKLQQSLLFRKASHIEAGMSCDSTDFDAAVNAAPSLDTLVQGLDRLRAGGTFCLFSGFSQADSVPAAIINHIHYRQLHVAGAYGCTRRQMQKAVEILSDHRSCVENLIDDVIDLQQVPDALPSILSGRALKFVVAL